LLSFALIINITERCGDRSENMSIFPLFDESNVYVLDQWKIISLAY